MNEKGVVLITALAVFFLLSGYTLKVKQKGKKCSQFLFFKYFFHHTSKTFIRESKRRFFSYQKVYYSQKLMLFSCILHKTGEKKEKKNIDTSYNGLKFQYRIIFKNCLVFWKINNFRLPWLFQRVFFARAYSSHFILFIKTFYSALMPLSRDFICASLIFSVYSKMQLPSKNEIITYRIVCFEHFSI